MYCNDNAMILKKNLYFGIEKGFRLVYDFYSQRGKLFTLNVFHCFFSLLAGSMLSRIGPKWSTSSRNGAIGPIRDIIKSTIAATGQENAAKGKPQKKFFF